MKNTLRNYPKKDGDRKLFVRWPVQVTEADVKAKKFIGKAVQPGHWVAVNVLKDGYKHLPAAVPYNTEAECQKACDLSNELHGFTRDEAEHVVSLSMGLVTAY